MSKMLNNIASFEPRNIYIINIIKNIL